MARKQTALQKKKSATLLQSDGKPLPDFEKIVKDHESYNANLIYALNYAAYVYELSDKKGFARDYAKDRLNISVNAVPDYEFNHIGSVCWLLLNDCYIKSKDEYDEKIRALVAKYKKEKQEKKSQSNNVIKLDQPTIRTHHIISELEGIIDDVVLRKENITQPLDVFKSIDGTFHTEKVREHFQKQLDDVQCEDEDAKEGYNLSEIELQCITGALNIILSDLETFKEEVKPVQNARKATVRKPKKIVPTKMVRKLNYMKTFKDDDLDLKSVPPAKIITADVVWIYNTKTKKLAQYVAQDKGGIMCKGSTLYGFDHDQSSQKTLRNPKETLTQLDKCGKVDQRTLLNGLTTKAMKVNGRVNNQCIIVKVY